MDLPNETAKNTITNQPQKRVDNADLIKSSFWISQIFMIVATVAGVYLAAQEGLSQALLFENLNSKEKNYYLQRALSDELTDNMTTLNNYADFITEKSPYDLKPHRPLLSLFVWENMKYSSSTLETPSHILSAARRFNSESQSLIAKIEKRHFGRKEGAKRIRVLTQSLQENGITPLTISYTSLYHELTEAGIQINKI